RLGHDVMKTDARKREVVMFVGSPAAGKSTAVAPFLEQGYVRLNRDERGGTLDDLLAPLGDVLSEVEGPSVVMDNTYGTRRQRRGVLETAARHGVPVRAIWLQTGLDDAMINACQRLLDKYGRMLTPDEIKQRSRKDPNTFPPAALYGFAQRFEAPSLGEGLVRIDTVEFVRDIPSSHVRKAVLFDI